MNVLPDDPASQLDSLGTLRRALMGLFSAISALFAGMIGILLIVERPAGWFILGDVLLFLAGFFILLAARFWLGKRRFLDRVINVLFSRAYWCLLGIVLLFLALVGIGLTVSLWNDLHR